MNIQILTTSHTHTVLLLLALLATGLYCVALHYRLIRNKTEGKRLLDMVKQLSLHTLPHSNISFKDNSLKRLWEFFKLTNANENQLNTVSNTYQEAITLTRKLAGVSGEKNLTAQRLVELLTGVGPEIQAVAVVLRNSRTGRLEIETISGVPRTRIEEALLTHFDELFDPIPKQTGKKWGYWGYVNPDRRELLDFSAFDVGMSLLVPLREQLEIIGGVWLGFKVGCSTLTPERKTFVHAVAQHASASLYAAHKVSENTAASKQEREILLGMSHDLRSPGNTALYCVMSLLDGARGSLTEEQRLDLEIVKRALHNQFSILGDVFDFAKFQNGKLDPNRTILPLPKVVDSTIKDYNRTISKRGLTFLAEPTPNVYINVDVNHLQRVLVNFLSNAEKYTTKGSVAVQFSVQNDFVEIHVVDTGIGIPRNVSADVLFQQFQRFDNAKGKQGVGLGLAVTKVLADSNGGYVRYEQNTPDGSKFTVGISRSKCEVLKPTVIHNTKLAHFNKIVIADDDDGVRNTFARYLNDTAKTIIPTSSLAETKAALRQHDIDLLITDMEFNDGTAINLFEKQMPTCHTIICSGVSNLTERFPLLRSQQIVILEKPVARNTLLLAIERYSKKNITL